MKLLKHNSSSVIWMENETLYHMEYGFFDKKTCYFDIIIWCEHEYRIAFNQPPSAAIVTAELAGIKMDLHWHLYKTESWQVDDIDEVIKNPLPYFLRLSLCD